MSTVRERIKAASGDQYGPRPRRAAGPPVGPPFSGLGKFGAFGRYGHDAGLNQEQYLHNCGYVYSIIRTIANRIIGQPVVHARKLPAGKRPGKAFSVNRDFVPDCLKNEAHQLRTFTESPILAAFRDPNPIMVRYTVMFNTVASLELTGKAFWWLRWGPGRKPEIWPLPSHWVTPVHTPTLFSSWIVEPGGGAQRFSLPGTDVCYFYYPDPGDPLNAYAPLTALAKTVMADESLEEAQRRTFINSMSPGLAFTIGQAAEDSPTGRETSPVLTRPQRRALKTILKDEYKGVVNSGEPMLLDGFIKDVKPIFATPKEMDYLNSGTATKGRLAQGWGVNPISMGEVEGANRASSAVADDHLLNNVVNPRISMLSEIMTCWLPRFFSGRRDEVVYLQPAASKDIDWELSRDTQMFDRGAKSINEWRDTHGMPPVKKGNRAFVAAAASGSGGAGEGEDGAAGGSSGEGDSGGWVDVEIEDNKPTGGPSGGSKDQDAAELVLFAAEYLRKVRDDEGHNHDADGRFGSGGSGGGSDGGSNKPQPADHGEPASLPDKADADAVKSVRDHTDKAAKNWTSSEKGALSDYTTDISIDLNADLRAGKEITDRDMKDIVKGVDSIFAKTPTLSEPVSTFRGVRFDSPEEVKSFLEGMNKLRDSGELQEHKAYTSTSLDPGVAKSFLRDKPGIIIHCDAHHGIGVEGQVSGGDAANEKEFLMPRGGKFKVLSVHPADGDKPAVVRMRQVVDDKSKSAKPWAGPPLSARQFVLKNWRKLVDDSGHEHGSDGRFGHGSGGGGSSGDTKPKPKPHGTVDDSDKEHAERAVGFMAKIKEAGKKAVAVAKKVGESAKVLAYQATWHAISTKAAEEICDTSHDYSKIINAKGVSWLEQHLGIGGNFAAVVASHVLSYGLTKLKQHLAKRRRAKEEDGKLFDWLFVKGDEDDSNDDDEEELTPDEKAKAVWQIVTKFAADMGCPDDDLPSVADVRKYMEDRDDDEADDDSEEDDEDEGDKSFSLPAKSIAAGWGVKATAKHFRDMVDVHRRELASTLSGVLSGLGAQAVAEIRKHRGDDASHAVDHAIDAAKWEEAVKDAVEDVLTAAARSGASGEWVVNHKGGEARRLIKAGLPGRLMRAVGGLVSHLLAGKTWGRMVRGIVDATKKAVGRAVRKGDDPGDAAAGVLTEPLTVGAASARAADVEASAAVNGGRHAAFQQLMESGKVFARRWMTCRDARVRDTHRRAHNQVARGDAPFIVGGEECSYPGDPVLSASQRCRCRCVAISITGG